MYFILSIYFEQRLERILTIFKFVKTALLDNIIVKPKSEVPKSEVKTKRTWADTIITWAKKMTTNIFNFSFIYIKHFK